MGAQDILKATGATLLAGAFPGGESSDEVIVRVYRDGADAADTLANSANFVKADIFFVPASGNA